MHKCTWFTACFLLFAFRTFAQSGAPDPGFGNAGLITVLPAPVFNKAYGLAVQADGKILLAGYAQVNGANVFALVRLLPNSDPDLSFGVNGVVKTPVGADALCYTLALQADGKILLAGTTTLGVGGSGDFALLRYRTDGAPDSSFAGDGIQTLSFGTGDDAARAIALQPDGKILLAGTSETSNGSLMAVARFTPEGLPDPSFSNDGKTTIGIGTFFTRAYALALQPDGKIILAGDAKFGMADDLALARFMPNGTPDASFGNAGTVSTNLGSDADSGNALAMQSDGKIIAAGITGDNRDFALLRYNPDGTLDAGFGNQGKATTDFDGSDDFANAAVLQPDGKIILGGYAYTSALPDFALVRYLSDGTPDAGFGNKGLVTTDFGDSYDYGFPLAIQPDGKILLGGYSFSNSHTAFAAARYLSGLDVGVVDFSAPFSCFVAPNPVGQRALFAFETARPGLFTLSLADGQGRLLQTFFADRFLAAGKHAEELHFSDNLPQGAYFVRLIEGGKQLSVKIFKQ